MLNSEASKIGSPELGLLTNRVVAESSPADDGAAQGEERVVDVVAHLPADAKAAEPVQQCECALHDPAVDARTGAVFGAAPGDVWDDLESADRRMPSIFARAAGDRPCSAR
jgi:hypothetical protein